MRPDVLSHNHSSAAYTCLVCILIISVLLRVVALSLVCKHKEAEILIYKYNNLWCG